MDLGKLKFAAIGIEMHVGAPLLWHHLGSVLRTPRDLKRNEHTRMHARDVFAHVGGGRNLITPGYAPAGAMFTRRALAGPALF